RLPAPQPTPPPATTHAPPTTPVTLRWTPRHSAACGFDRDCAQAAARSIALGHVYGRRCRRQICDGRLSLRFGAHLDDLVRQGHGVDDCTPAHASDNRST